MSYKMTYTRFDKPSEKPKRETSEKVPLDNQRNHTDLPYLVVFGFFLTFWIAIAIYAFIVGDVYEILRWQVHLFDILQFMTFAMHEGRYFILGYLAFSMTILSIFIALYRWATKVLVWITIILTSIILVLVYGLIGFCIYQQVLSPFVVLPLIVIAIIYGMVISAFTKIGIKMVCQVIHESCKAMFFFPSIVLFIGIQFIVNLLVVGFSLSIYLHLNTIRYVDVNTSWNETEIEDFSYTAWEKYNTPIPYYIYFLQIVNLCGFLWASNFIMGVGRMILTATFATWFHIKDRRSIPKLTLLKCTQMVVRYHLGTVAYASSLFSLFTMVYIICKYACDRLKEMCKRPTSILSWITMLLKFNFDALAMCAVHGRGFFESAKDSYILTMKHPLSFLTINTVSESIIFLGTLLITAVPFLATLAYVLIFDEVIISGVHMTALFISTIISLIMSMTFFLLFRAASNTIRFLYFEESKFTQESEIDMYEIQTDISVKEVVVQ